MHSPRRPIFGQKPSKSATCPWVTEIFPSLSNSGWLGNFWTTPSRRTSIAITASTVARPQPWRLCVLLDNLIKRKRSLGWIDVALAIRGLRQAVQDAQPESPQNIQAAMPLEEAVATRSLSRLMAEIDQVWDRLKKVPSPDDPIKRTQKETPPICWICSGCHPKRLGPWTPTTPSKCKKRSGWPPLWSPSSKMARMPPNSGRPSAAVAAHATELSEISRKYWQKFRA